MSNDAVKDHLLCAFLDEELSQDELDNLLELLECDEVRARASRQSLAGSVMSNQKTLCVDISASVRAAIQQEAPLQAAAPTLSTAARRSARRWFARKQTVDASSRAVRRRWQVPAAGVALAASVAVAAVVVVRPAGTEINSATQQLAAAQPAASEPAAANAVDVEQLFASAQQQSAGANVRMRPTMKQRANGAQLVAAGSHSTTRAGGRELVIAAPAQDRPVSAQWALVGNQGVAAANQQRAREQLNTYLINHARHGGGAALTGSLAYARVAARPTQHTASE